MSSTVVSAIVIILATILPLFGIKFDSALATEVVQAGAVIVSAIVVWYQRTHNLSNVGSSDVTVLGRRKG